MDALVNVLEDEVLILHCHENGDCHEPDRFAHAFSELFQAADGCQSERVSSELHCCQEEDAQVVGWCHDQDDVHLHLLLLELFRPCSLVIHFSDVLER